MAGLNQDGRLLQIKTALGPDTFLLRRLVASEGIEQPFTLHGELLSDRDDITPDQMLGTALTCTVNWPAPDAARYFHGVVGSFGRTGTTMRSDMFGYRFEAVPRMWFLTHSMDCRIFQDSTVEDILKKVFSDRKVEGVSFRHMPGGTRTYCVQFNETDFDFVHRLLDEAGCTYFFEHANGSHTFVIIGDASGFPNAPGGPLVVRGEPDRPDAVTGWTSHIAVQPAEHTTWDFDSLTPSGLQQAQVPTTLALPADMKDALKMYRWPGGQAVRPEASSTAELRMRRHEAQAESWSGRSERASLFAGAKVQVQEGLTGSPKPWLLTNVVHDAYDDTRVVDSGTSGYANSFGVIPGGQPWRSPVHRPRPVIPGVQSAIVVGPSGEEIHCDEYGRIKVHFLWDHLDDKKNETSSCWVRVAQSVAGAWGGAWFLPRMGDEVLVAFLDGDADRPVVIGSLFGGDGKPFWDLPGNKTRSGFNSRSSKKGTAANAHTIAFDDKINEEMLVFHAERDAVYQVERDLEIAVGGNEVHTVDGSHKDSTDGKRTTTIKGDETLTVQQGNRETKIQKGNETLTVSLGNLEVTVSAGNITIKAPAGNINIEAGLGIELKSGPSTIKLTPAGIDLKTLKLSTKADLLHDNKGAIKQHNGEGMLTLKGAITMIG